MANRDRKRAERRKRKERAAVRAETGAEPGVEPEDRMAKLAERTEAKNEAARAELEPLAEGERPRVVTVAAIVSTLLAVSIVIGWLAGIEVEKFGSDGIRQGEDKAPVLSVVASAGLMSVMAYGLWRARYWAVLGFQTLLVIVLVAASLGLVQATSVVQAVGTTVLIAGAGALFYFMVKAMARIQMPERRPVD